jgi:uncharacterized protein
MIVAGAGHRSLTVGPQSGVAVLAGVGEVVRVVDVEGHQVGDMWVIDAADPGRWLSASHTRDRCERLFPHPGERFCDQYGMPILELIADTSTGVHDMLFPACDRWLYESRGLPGHPNCRDNFLAALVAVDLSLPVVPDPVNLFQNSVPLPDGRLAIGAAASGAGDAISFRIQRDAVFVLTACSVDYPPLNGGRCGPLQIEITPAPAQERPSQRPHPGP